MSEKRRRFRSPLAQADRGPASALAEESARDPAHLGLFADPPSFRYLLPAPFCHNYHRSRAIARYIATKSKASPLIPVASDSDYLAKLAKFETAASVEYSNFDPSASGLAFELIFKKMKVSLVLFQTP